MRCALVFSLENISLLIIKPNEVAHKLKRLTC